MSILFMENFSFGEGFAILQKQANATQTTDPAFLAAVGGRIVQYMQTTATNVNCYTRYRFEKIEMLRDDVSAERPSVFIAGIAASNGYRYATAMYIPFPKTTKNDSKVWIGARMMQKIPESAGSISGTGGRLIMTVTAKNTDAALTASRKVLVVNHNDNFEIDRAANAAQGTGLSVFPKNTPGKPFFLDLEYDRATGVIRIWIDNIFCAETTGWPTGDSAAAYMGFGIDFTGASAPENGFYLTDLFFAEDDSVGWCDRFGPDFWAESFVANSDTINQWSRPVGYASNHEVVAKSSFEALDTSEAGNQDYLNSSEIGAVDAYKGEVFLKKNIAGVSSQSIIFNAGSAIHAIAPTFVLGDEVIDGGEVLVSANTSLPVPVRSLTTVNPATGQPFTKEEIEAMSFGLKVKS